MTLPTHLTLKVFSFNIRSEATSFQILTPPRVDSFIEEAVLYSYPICIMMLCHIHVGA